MRTGQKAVAGVLCLPVLYLVHLCLLQFYSSILLKDGYGQYQTSSEEHDNRIRPEDCPLFDFNEEQAESIGSPAQTSTSGRFAPPSENGRKSDIEDTFRDYKHAAVCGLSSLDIHMPFTSLCSDKTSVLNAMSGGGRPGYDMPYIPLGCDMRWYSTEEACGILSKYAHVAFIGDSIMRHIVNAMYVFLRKDVGYGGITDWNLDFTEAEDIKSKGDCMCAAQTGKHICSDAVISRTSWVAGNASALSDSNPLACSASENVDISFTRSNLYPASEDELREMSAVLPQSAFGPPDKPYAFILHSTFWNNVNTTATVAWVDQITEHLQSTVPVLSGLGARMNRLFTTANAGGLAKNEQYLEAQGNQQLGNFEKSIRPRLEGQGVDVLGFFNMSLQSITSDGTHASFSTNLLKAQMVLNWLDKLET